jgi:hypothetical protein
VRPDRYLKGEHPNGYVIAASSEIAIAQAQLNKVKNPPKLDKPDGEGWWWYLDITETFKRPIHYTVYELETEDFSVYKGTWQRAIVPE